MSTVYFSKEKKIKFAARVNEPSVPVVISFFNTDGTGHNISSYDFKLKVSSGSLQLFELSVGSGLTVQGDDSNQLRVELTEAIASQRLGVYFARLYNDDGTWLSGSFEFYEEARDSSTPTETITITENGTPVTVTITGGGAEVAAGTFVFCGFWDLSGNTVPTTGGTGAGGAIEAGNFFRVAVSSTSLYGPDGSLIVKGYAALALVDTPGTDLTDETKWIIFSSLTA